MHYIDILIIIPLIWGAYKGFSKGLIIEIASLASLIVGVYGAIKFSNLTADLLINKLELNSEYLPIISFAITFVIIVVLVQMIAKLINSMVKAVALGFINRILGAIFGTAKFVLLLSVIIVLINKFDKNSMFLSEKIKKESLLYQPLNDIILKIYPSIEELNFNSIKDNVDIIPENVQE